MSDIREEVKDLCIGLKIRRLRQERGMTLQNLSEASGLSKALLSQIENEQVIPPLATLLRIAKALKVGLHTFFQQEGSVEKCVLVRAGEGSQDSYSSRNRRRTPYAYQSLGYGKKQRSLEPFLIEFEVQPWRDDLLVSHEGEEFLYILEGRLEFHYGDEVMTVGPGDSLYYDSNEPHGYVAVGEGPARAVAVVYSQD